MMAVRLTVFESDERILLVYAPDADTLDLPSLPVPFTLSDVKASCAGRDVRVAKDHLSPVIGRIVRKRRNDERAERGQQDMLARQVTSQVLLTSTDAAEREMAQLVGQKTSVDDRLRQLKANIKAARRRVKETGQFVAPKAYQAMWNELDDLKADSQRIQLRLGQLSAKRTEERRAEEKVRERLFIQAARETLSKDVYLALWQAVDEKRAQEDDHG